MESAKRVQAKLHKILEISFGIPDDLLQQSDQGIGFIFGQIGGHFAVMLIHDLLKHRSEILRLGGGIKKRGTPVLRICLPFNISQLLQMLHRAGGSRFIEFQFTCHLVLGNTRLHEDHLKKAVLAAASESVGQKLSA
ncbi:hypothetical protein D3C73_1226840 [compost metagenome]